MRFKTRFKQEAVELQAEKGDTVPDIIIYHFNDYAIVYRQTTNNKPGEQLG